MPTNHQLSEVEPARHEFARDSRGAAGSENSFVDRRDSQATLSRLASAMDAGPPAAAQRKRSDMIEQGPHMQALLKQLAPMQRGAAKDAVAIQARTQNNAVQQRKEAPRANKTGLPDSLKSGVESLSGMSMDHVKVHYNSAQPAQMNAHAYAQGSEIHIAPGQEQHLPHEAWHVVQQAKGLVRPTTQLKDGTGVNDDRALEKDATVMGEKALALGQVQLKSAGGIHDLPVTGAGSSGSRTIQKSSIGEEADEAGPDQALARSYIESADNKITSIRTGEEGMDTEPELEEADTTDRTDKEHHGISVMLNTFDGRGEVEYYITEGQRASLHKAAEQNRWNFRYEFEGVDYHAQYRQLVQMAHPAQLAGVVAGALNPAAAKAAYGGPFAAGTAAAIAHAGLVGKNVSSGSSGNSLRRQPKGSGVGKTRPTDWVRFVAMTGGNPFKQGHQMHHLLGGHGVQTNLAPFTGSLNGLHYNRVEKLVLDQTRSAGRDQYADYSTVPTYGGNASIAGECIARFDLKTTAAKLAAMVTAGVLTAPQAALIAPAAPLPPAEEGLAHTWITNYVTDAFPNLITCTVRFIDYTAPTLALPAGAINATAPQVVTITNRT